MVSGKASMILSVISVKASKMLLVVIVKLAAVMALPKVLHLVALP